MLDADARAVRSARRNARTLGLAERCEVVWWDAQREPCPEHGFDLVLSNPPFHSGVYVDLSIAGALFERLGQAIAGGGRALVVANRTLPYEARPDRLGRLASLAVGRGYKLLRLQAPRRPPPRRAR